MNYRSTRYSHLVTLPVGRRRPSRVFEPLPQDKVTCMEIVGTAACSPLSLLDCSLLTPFIVSRSRIQVCGVMEGNCAKISTQIFSDQWSSHTYSQQHKYHRLSLFPWHVHSSIFHSALKTKHIQGVWRNGKSRHILRILFALSPQGNLVIWSSKRGHNKQTHC